MRVAVLCSGAVLQPALQALASQNLLVGLGVPDRMPEMHAGLEQAARQINIPFVYVSSTDIEDQLAGWLEASSPDVVCVMGFPYKIPEHLLQRPRLGFFNLHGGALPRYRGPDPVFWQISNREPAGAITIHRMMSELDTGGIAHAESVPIGPEDTYGLHMQLLGAMLPRVMIEFVQRLAIQGDKLSLTEQPSDDARYWKRPTEVDRTIDWNASSETIAALVRACNPLYAGAMTTLRGIPIRLLQVSDGGKSDMPQQVPGLILGASSEDGIRVACGDGRTLFLDIVYTGDGFYTGQHLVGLLGVRMGEQVGVPESFGENAGQVPN